MILDRDTWREVGETIGRNKRRSIATAFGVFWGIFMLIILLGLSNGFRNGIDQATSSISPNFLVLNSSVTSLPYKGLPRGRDWYIEEQELSYIKQRCPEVAVAAGNRTKWLGTKGISYGSNGQEGGVLAITPEYFDAIYPKLIAGRMLSALDYAENRKFCLLGLDLAKSFFGDPTAGLGKTIKANNTYFVVVGIVGKKSRMVQVGINLDRAVVVPIDQLKADTQNPKAIHMVVFTIKEDVDKTLAKERIEQVIKELKLIAPEDKKAVRFFDLDEMLSTFRGINLGITVLVWIVGIGTLLTGVVGISNILLVTVKERTQEIGVRRALGARPTDIIGQLMMESLSLTMLAGLIGIVLGVGVMSLIAQNFTEMGEFPFVNPVVDLGIVLVALLIIILGGVVAGLIPAIKAVEVKAIEAIREE